MKKFTILSRTVICENPWIPVEKQRVVLPNGEEADWFLTRGHRVVIVIPFLQNGEVLLQKTYKHGAGEVISEFCAGMVESDESPKDAAIRELAEETGFCAAEMVPIGEAFGNPTGSETRCFFFLARDCVKTGETRLDSAEQIENFTVPCLSDAKQILCSTPSSAGAIAAIAFAEEYFSNETEAIV